MRRLFSGIAFVLVLAFASHVWAADLGIVARETTDPFVPRLMRELEQLGLSVTRASSVEGSSDVAVLVVANDGSLDLYDRQPDGTRRHRHLVAARGDALKVAEEVHALMLPLVERRPEPPKAEPPLPPPPAPPKEEPQIVTEKLRPTTFEASAGAGVLIGGATPGLAVTLGLAYPYALRAGRLSFGGGIVVLLGAIPEKVSADAGTTDVRPLLFGPEVLGRLDIARGLTTDLGLGAFAANVRFTARAAPPFQTRDESAWTFAPNARIRALYNFGSVGLFAEGRMGLAFPAITVRFAGEGVHEWGRPWATAGGGVAIAF